MHSWSATGINNCGTATLALFSAGIPEYDRLAAAKLQATQVSVISVWNCSGRILIGQWLSINFTSKPLLTASHCRRHRD